MPIFSCLLTIHVESTVSLVGDNQKEINPFGFLFNEKGLLPSEWVNWGESFPERLAGEEFGEFFYRGKSGQAFLRLHADYPSPL